MHRTPENPANSQTTSSQIPSASEQSGSRRDFLRSGTGVVVGGTVAANAGVPSLAFARSAHPAGSDTVRLGLIGCGGRGTGAVCHAMNAESCNVELHSMADVFGNRMGDSLETCVDEHGEKIQVPEERQHTGFDAFKRVIDSNVDMVILATPPGFRPLHFETAIDAGKHVFMEKPVAVDPPGVRRVLAAGKKAAEKGLAVQVGLQRRHEIAYRETIQKLKDGAIGRINFSRVYWNSNGVWVRQRDEEQTELEYQMRNWYYFNWLCGDHIVEQHIHNLDVINWLMDDYPETAQGQGGRLLRNGEDHGQIFDHHMVEYHYPNGHVMLSQSRHMPDCWNSVGEHVHGTEGSANIGTGQIFDLEGNEIFKCVEGRGQRGGHQQEHYDLFADMANGLVPNETEYGARSTMTAILGRLATYTGKKLRMEDALNSELSLADVDSLKSMDDEAPVKPDAKLRYPIPVPGAGYREIIDWEPEPQKKRKRKKKDS